MKRLVEEVNDEGLDGLLGQTVTLFCLNYIYEGKLVGINDTCIKLEPASVVYETGPLMAESRKDSQPLPGPWYVQIAAIESFGALKGQ